MVQLGQFNASAIFRSLIPHFQAPMISPRSKIVSSFRLQDIVVKGGSKQRMGKNWRQIYNKMIDKTGFKVKQINDLQSRAY
jgi:hypothetical protein